MPSLKKSLLFHIQSQGEATLNELHQIARDTNHKESNCERQLRSLSEGENAPVKPLKNEKGHITGYYYV